MAALLSRTLDSETVQRILSLAENLRLKRLRERLDQVSLQLIEELDRSELGRAAIRSSHLMYLGGGWLGAPTYAGGLAARGASVTMLDACPEGLGGLDSRFHVISDVLNSTKGPASFCLTTPRDSSSLYPLNPAKIGRYGFLKHIVPDTTVRVDATTLRDLRDAGKIPPLNPTYVCLDLQGGELAALQGTWEGFFDDLMVVTTEVCIVDLYVGQPLLPDYLDFFRPRGYEILSLGETRSSHSTDIYPHRWNRQVPLGARDLYTDITFCRSKDVGALSPLRLTAMAIAFLAEYRYSECLEMLSREDIPAEVRQCFHRAAAAIRNFF